MLNLIKAEVYKLKHQKWVIVLFITVIAISAFSAFSEINQLTAPDSPVSGKMSFANAFQDIFMLFMLAIFAGFYIGSDFTNRTIQAVLAKGHKRLELICSKAFVFSISAALMMLLYPITVCLIHTMTFGWGEPFHVNSLYYLFRVALLGSMLNMATAYIYVCFAFICRDIPKTICVCFAFPVVFSAISSTLGKQFPIIGTLLDYATISQLKYIVGDTFEIVTILSVVFSACLTIFAALFITSRFFAKAELK